MERAGQPRGEKYEAKRNRAGKNRRYNPGDRKGVASARQMAVR